MNQETKKRIAPKVKNILNKYGMKGTLSVDNHSTLVLTLTSGAFDFSNMNDRRINTYHIQNYDEKFQPFFRELVNTMNEGNHDNSDIQSDYFDVGWYIEIKIGKYNKPYVFKH